MTARLPTAKRAKRLTKPQRYEQAKQQWMLRHPHATPKQYEEFIRSLIVRLGL